VRNGREGTLSAVKASFRERIGEKKKSECRAEKIREKLWNGRARSIYANGKNRRLQSRGGRRAIDLGKGTSEKKKRAGLWREVSRIKHLTQTASWSVAWGGGRIPGFGKEPITKGDFRGGGNDSVHYRLSSA